MSRRNRVNTQIWKYYQNDDFVYPEVEIKATTEPTNETFSIAMSGGGTRAATSSTGYMHAIHKMGLIDRVQYLSGCSGGGWFAVPYTFLPQEFDDKTFFGKYLKPGKLSSKEVSSVNHYSFQYVISETKLAMEFLKKAFTGKGDETFSRTLGELFLKQYNLNDKDKFFTLNQATLNKAINKNSRLHEHQFYVAREGRPFLIAGGTILDHELFSSSKMFQVEYTPYYTGVRQFHYNDKEPIGGGYIESFAYDSREPKKDEDDLLSTEVRIDKRFFTTNEFTLSDVMGSTGAAPQIVLDKFLLRFVGFPEFRHWAVIPDRKKEYYDDQEFSHTDGGVLENLGIMPLLARKVKNIICFVHSKTPFQYNSNNRGLDSRMASSIKNLFFPTYNRLILGGHFDKNIILEGGEDKYLEIVDNFKEKVKGGAVKDGVPYNQPLIHYGTYNVLNNDFYGIEGYDNVKIIWVYNAKVLEWEESLHSDFREKLKSEEEFENFPHYKTFGENFPNIIDLTLPQTVLLSNLCNWVLKKEKKNILKFFFNE